MFTEKSCVERIMFSVQCKQDYKDTRLVLHTLLCTMDQIPQFLVNSELITLHMNSENNTDCLCVIIQFEQSSEDQFTETRLSP